MRPGAAFALATLVIRDCLETLPIEDRQDIIDLLPDIFGNNEEDRKGSVEVAYEIFKANSDLPKDQHYLINLFDL